MKVSIIIPTYNEEKYIEKCLSSIENQTYNIGEIEVLVIDGMSTDNTRKIIMSFKESTKLNLKLIDNQKQTAPYAMNIGLEYSKGDIVIRIDGHAYIDKKFIENSVDILLKNPEVSCVGGKIKTISDNEIGENISYAMMSPFGVGDAKFRYSEKEEFVDTLAFGAYRKEIFGEIGLFDESFVRNQDDELNYRLIKSGNKILLSPKIKSFYYGRNSIKNLFTQYFQYGYWKVKVLKKHKQITTLRQLVPVTFVLSILILGIVALFNKLVLYMLLGEMTLYLLCAIYFSLKLKNRFNLRKWKGFIKIFLILHISYGVGYLLGIKDFIFLNKKGNLNKVSR